MRERYAERYGIYTRATAATVVAEAEIEAAKKGKPYQRRHPGVVLLDASWPLMCSSDTCWPIDFAAVT